MYLLGRVLGSQGPFSGSETRISVSGFLNGYKVFSRVLAWVQGYLSGFQSPFQGSGVVQGSRVIQGSRVPRPVLMHSPGF